MAVITEILATTNVGDDRSTINTNFENLNSDKAEQSLVSKNTTTTLFFNKLNEGYVKIDTSSYLEGLIGLNLSSFDFSFGFIANSSDWGSAVSNILVTHPSGANRLLITLFNSTFSFNFVDGGGGSNVYALNPTPNFTNNNTILFIITADRNGLLTGYAFDLDDLTQWGSFDSTDISAEAGTIIGSGNSGQYFWCNDTDTTFNIFKPLFFISEALDETKVNSYIATLKLDTVAPDFLDYQKFKNDVQLLSNSNAPAEIVDCVILPNEIYDNTVELEYTNAWSASTTSEQILTQDLIDNKTIIAEWWVKSTSTQTFNFGDESDATRYDSALSVGTAWTPVILDNNSWDGTNGELRVEPTSSYTGSLYSKIKLLKTNN